ncbi:MAG: metal ABC transporter substrate-binding protein [Acidimicrobiales bacterium]
MWPPWLTPTWCCTWTASNPRSTRRWTRSEGTAFDAAAAARLERRDPHFWLDPTRLAAVGEAFARQLGVDRADSADTFRNNAEALARSLNALDRKFETGLSSCENRNLVTSHAAFGYLARRYRLTPVAITGLSPEEEAAPGEIAEITEFVKDERVTTIYFETLVSPAIAETIARETGAEAEVLDPIEGLTDDAEGDDYLEVMRANLATLVEGQRCR